VFQVRDSEEWISIEELDGKSPNPGAFYKDMLGWNRKALRVSIPANSSDVQVAAVETMCALSAKPWVEAAAKADGKTA
jgi:hypothetical protein